MASVAHDLRVPTQAIPRPTLVSPLTRLSRMVRTYVVVEGVASIIILACLWMWATFLVDWGMFKVFRVDYVQHGSGVSALMRGLFWGMLLIGPLLIALALPLAVPVMVAALAPLPFAFHFLAGWFLGLAAVVSRRLSGRRTVWLVIQIIAWVLIGLSLLNVLGCLGGLLVGRILEFPGEVMDTLRFLLLLNLTFVGGVLCAIPAAFYDRLIRSSLPLLPVLGGVVGIIVYKFGYRLFASFRESSLALALERRFPQLLGDRLVTAVELADPVLARRYGYSWVMIEQTAEQAESRIDQLSLTRVFNWRRLLWRCLLAAGLVLSVLAFGWFATTEAAIWKERTVQFMDTPWPPDTMVDLPGFRDADTKAVARGSDMPVKMEAWRYVVGTRKDPKGWRQLHWIDLFPDKDLLGADRKPVAKPDIRAWELADPCFSWEYYNALPESWQHLPLDEIGMRVEAAKTFADKKDTANPEVQAWLTELGRGSIEYVRGRIAQARKEGKDQLDAQTLALAPVDWQKLPLDSLDEYLSASQRLTPGEANRLRLVMYGDRLNHQDKGLVVPMDAVQALHSLGSPIKTPIFTTGVIQHDFYGRLLKVAQGELWVLDAADMEQLVPFAMITPPIITAADIDRLVLRKPLPHVPPVLSQADLDFLPRDWRGLSAPDLEARLKEFGETKSPEKLGDGMRKQLSGLFEVLDQRAGQSHIGKRQWFRRLEIPDKVTVEFEQVLTEEERARTPPKLGSPKVPRTPGTTSFVYEFKKIEQPLRFRVTAGDARSAWFKIDVRPLPALAKLWREQEEPGYLHRSTTRVKTYLGNKGRPENDKTDEVSLEGEESRIEVPSGTRLWFKARSYKPLQLIRIKPLAQDDGGKGLQAKVACQVVSAPALALDAPGLGGPLMTFWSMDAHDRADKDNPYLKNLNHTFGSPEFDFALTEIVNDEVRLVLHFTDTDGIPANRRLTVSVTPDKEPEFLTANFEIVRREMVTNQVIIPFTIQVRDDHGLTAVWYEVTAQKLDGKEMTKQVFPLRRFVPIRYSQPGQAPAQYEDYQKVRARFERGELSFGRLMVTELFDAALPEKRYREVPYRLGELQLAQTGLAQLGLAQVDPFCFTPLVFCQMPAIELTRQFEYTHPNRRDNEIPIGPADEYLDTMRLQGYGDPDNPPKPGRVPEGGPPNPDDWAPPYKLIVRIIATDNRVRSDEHGNPVLDPQQGKVSEAIEFLVVDDGYIIGQMNDRELDIRDRLVSIWENLNRARLTVNTLRKSFEVGDFKKPEDLDVAIAYCQDAARTFRDASDAMDRDVIREMRLIYRELLLNRCQAEQQRIDYRNSVVGRIDLKICRPGEELRAAVPASDQAPSFDRAVKAFEELGSLLGEKRLQTPPTAFDPALRRADRVIERVAEILEEMRKLEDINKVISQIRNIIDIQDRINKAIEQLRKKKLEDELKGTMP